MAGRKRTAAAGPLAVVASLGGRRAGGRRKASGALDAGAIADRIRGMVAGPLPKGIAKRIPSRRKRKKMLRNVPRQFDRLSKVASGVGTALTVAAAAAEVITNVRGSQQPTEKDDRGQRDRGKKEQPDRDQNAKEMRRAS
jgi:hypothetical protein